MSETNEGLLQALQQIPTLSNMPEKTLQWLVDKGEVIQLQPGDYLFQSGRQMLHMMIMLHGRVTIQLRQQQKQRLLGYVEDGDIAGTLPFSRGENYQADGMVEQPSEVYRLPKEYFRELIQEHYELAAFLVGTMTTRVRNFTKNQLRDEKMMALGKLSAGLAHELNNPSAAVIRSSQHLKKHLSFLPDNFKRVLQIQLPVEDVDAINTTLFARAKQPLTQSLTMLQKSSRVEDIVDWLEEHDLEDAEDQAEVLVDFGFDLDELEELLQPCRSADIAPIANWMAQVLTTEKLVSEIEDASQRINTLVGSVKRYTHMDQDAGRQFADIHEGITSTLTMLQHKIKKGKVQVDLALSEDMPGIQLFISEMNQVWTNLIDNALDAMEHTENPRLRIESDSFGGFARIKLIDNGPGIPEEIQSSVFDPFFTTKDVGKGTGMGLEVAQNVVARHNGKITLVSAPGETIFEVCIPIE